MSRASGLGGGVRDSRVLNTCFEETGRKWLLSLRALNLLSKGSLALHSNICLFT